MVAMIDKEAGPTVAEILFKLADTYPQVRTLLTIQ